MYSFPDDILMFGWLDLWKEIVLMQLMAGAELEPPMKVIQMIMMTSTFT
jgi:hypothetical protein